MSPLALLLPFNTPIHHFNLQCSGSAGTSWYRFTRWEFGIVIRSDRASRNPRRSLLSPKVCKARESVQISPNLSSHQILNQICDTSVKAVLRTVLEKYIKRPKHGFYDRRCFNESPSPELHEVDIIWGESWYTRLKISYEFRCIWCWKTTFLFDIFDTPISQDES